MNSSFEKQYYKLHKEEKQAHFYCVEDEQIYLKGTHASQINKADHSYVDVEVDRCVEAERNLEPLGGDCVASGDEECTVDPKCADDYETWAMHKRIIVKVMNSKVDFSVDTKDPIR